MADAPSNKKLPGLNAPPPNAPLPNAPPPNAFPPSALPSSAFPATAVSRSGQRCWIDVAQPTSSDAWSVQMDTTPFIVGRTPESHLRLDHDTVSRRHAQFYRDPFGRIWIRDLESRNGVKVNDEKIAEQLVEPDDIIRIGQFRLRIRLEADRLAAAPLPVADVLPASSELELSTIRSIDGSRIAVEHLSSILALGARLLQTPDPAARMQMTADLLIDPQLAAEAVWLLRVEKQRPDRPQMIFGPILRGQNSPTTLHVSATLLREVIRTGQAHLATNDPASRSIELSLPAEVQLIAAAACPISTRGDWVDLLYVIYPIKRAIPEWLALTSLVANQFAQSDAIWATRRDLEKRAVIDHDLKQASQIQKRLLPPKIQINHLDVAFSFEPCRWVGGDYLDVIPMPGNRVLLAVGDACGKGLQAALVASWIHTMVRTGARAGQNLSALIDSMNVHLRSYLLEGAFVTFFAMMLDVASGEFEYVNAGHPPALLLKPNEKILHLSEGSVPLGLEGGSEPIVVSRGQLRPGDAVLLYTDGWTDMPGPTGSPMGFSEFSWAMEELWKQSARLPAAELIRRASLALSRHARLGGNFADDRSLVAVRRQ